MWLVTGIDEEHRFPDWVDAVAFYRQIVEDWVAANGTGDVLVVAAVDDLPPGASHQIEFPTGSGDGEKVHFRLAWEVRNDRAEHFVAC